LIHFYKRIIHLLPGRPGRRGVNFRPSVERLIVQFRKRKTHVSITISSSRGVFSSRKWQEPKNPGKGARGEV